MIYLELRPQEEVHVPELETIIILHTNDSHGYLLPEGDTGGFAYIASIVDNERTQNPGRVLLLDAGDIVDGTPVGDMFYGRSVITVMNAMGYDAMTLGNHEMGKYGIKEARGAISIENDFLMDLRENAEFPLLAANVLINGSDPFPSYVIKEVGGVRIGIIGVTTNQYPPRENVEILDPATTAIKCVKEIKDNVDIIIALTHLGLDADKPFALLVKGVDVVIGGHSHTVMREPENMGGTMIVQAGCHGEYVGRIQLEYDVTNHEIANFSYELIAVKHPPLEENEEIAELVGHYDNMISSIFNVEIGYTEHGLSLSETGEAIAESYILKTGADVGYQNTGGVRANIPAGSITMRQAYEVMPFPYDRLVSMDLRGDYLKEEFPYGYMAGVYQENGVWYLKDGELIEDNGYYRVATNDYIITSYGFAYGENITYHGFCWDAFVDYLENTFPA
jgi:2',3'-cyclic-nucleotide 2'-phosphodiesterase (5'-nucleotidase family)